MNKSDFTIELGKQELTITQVLNAPLEAVFKAHLDPAAIPQWWGPGYLETTVELLEARAGGRWRFAQRDPQGNVFAFYRVYHEVTAPNRIVQTFEFSGAAGHVQLETLTLEDIFARQAPFKRKEFVRQVGEAKSVETRGVSRKSWLSWVVLKAR